MIKLMNNQNMWESPEYSHPQQTGENSVSYTLTHNFGKQPDKIIVYVKNSAGLYCEKYDYNYYPPESKGYGFSIDKTQCTLNSTVVQLSNVGGSGNQIVLFRCFNLGTTQTITNITPAFQWSSSEQIYPLEKAEDGSVLYCKYVNCGSLPNNGSSNTAHGVSNFNAGKVHKYWGKAWTTGGTMAVAMLGLAHPDNAATDCHLADANITMFNRQDMSAYSNSRVYIIYAK